MSYLRNELMRGRAELLMHSSRSCRFPETTGASCQPREGQARTHRDFDRSHDGLQTTACFYLPARNLIFTLHCKGGR